MANAMIIKSAAAGLMRPVGAEIFNDYNNNIAGLKGYYIYELQYNKDDLTAPATFILTKEKGKEPLVPFETGYNVGDVISFESGQQCENAATITEINNNVITVNGLPSYFAGYNVGTEPDTNVFYVNTKPQTGAVAFGYYAHAEGEQTAALERGSHAEGKGSRAIGVASHAEGMLTQAYYCAHAEGLGSQALEDYAHAEGWETTSEGQAAHSEGRLANAVGKFSHAEGNSTVAEGEASHAEGRSTKAVGHATHVEGYQTEAHCEYGHAEGKTTKVYANAGHAEGLTTRVGQITDGVITDPKVGQYGHAEGYSTVVLGEAGHAEGFGSNVLAVAKYGHAEGYKSKAEGENTHAEGIETRAIAEGSHAEGYKTQTSGKYSHTSGEGTLTNKDHQFAIGKWNDTNNVNAIFMLGNGTSSANRVTTAYIEKTGKAWFNGGVLVGSKKEELATLNRVTDLENRVEDLNTLIEDHCDKYATEYFILESPNGSQWKISIDDNGEFIKTKME